MNDRLPEKIQKQLLKALESAVEATSADTSPEEILGKVASENGFSPNVIRTLTTAYNKARAVRETCTGNRTFPVADPEKVISNVYSMPEQGKIASSLPSPREVIRNAEQAQNLFDMWEKRADAEEAEDIESILRYYSTPAVWRKTAGEMKKVAADYHRIKNDRFAEVRDRMFVSMQKAGEAFRRLRESEKKAAAQNCVNAFGDVAEKLFIVLNDRYGTKIPSLQKTAHAAVFPLREPYLAVTETIENGKALRNLQPEIRLVNREKEICDKVAEEVLDKAEHLSNIFQESGSKYAGFFDNFAANVMSGHIDAAEKADRFREKLTDTISPVELSADKALSPEFLNRLSELQARKNFFELALYDKDLQNYSMQDLAEAYNNSVQIAPESLRKPAQLRNLMLRSLETGGVMDPYELSVIADLEKKNVETRQKAEMMDAKEREGLLPASKYKSMQDLLGTRKPKEPMRFFQGLGEKAEKAEARIGKYRDESRIMRKSDETYNEALKILTERFKIPEDQINKELLQQKALGAASMDREDLQIDRSKIQKAYVAAKKNELDILENKFSPTADEQQKIKDLKEELMLRRDQFAYLKPADAAVAAILGADPALMRKADKRTAALETQDGAVYPLAQMAKTYHPTMPRGPDAVNFGKLFAEMDKKIRAPKKSAEKSEKNRKQKP